jgi:hypothetical protein
MAWMHIDSYLHLLDGSFISILTHDAALYGHYAKCLLNNQPHIVDVHSIEYLIYTLVTFTPFSLDQILYFSPMFLAPLVVIPTLLLAKHYIDSKSILFAIGIFSGIGFGFYSRSYLGYFDTDTLNLFFVMFILYGVVTYVKSRATNRLIVLLLSNLLFMTWYHSSIPLIYGLNGLFLLYLFIQDYKKTENYKVALLVIVSIIPLSFAYKLLLLASLFIVFRFLNLSYKYYLFTSIFVLLFLLLFQFDIVELLMFHSKRYLFRETMLLKDGFYFVPPMDSIAESSKASFQAIITLLSGNIIILMVSLVGYLLLLTKHKEMLLSLPLIAIGLGSFIMGPRFHFYATAILIIGFFYLAYVLMKSIKLKSVLILPITLLLSTPLMYESYKTIYHWNKQAYPIFTAQQIKVLQKLEQEVKPSDYAVTWWDYGWPLKYYTGLNTIIDNGIHHADNYLIAQILLSQEAGFTYNTIEYFYELHQETHTEVMPRALQNYNSMYDFWEDIRNQTLHKPHKVDKYIILPFQIAQFGYTMYKFKNIDPITGKRLDENQIFLQYYIVGEDKRFIYLTDHTKLDKQTFTVVNSDQSILHLSSLDLTFSNGTTPNVKQFKSLYIEKPKAIVYGNKFYIVSDDFYHSLLIQMLIFGNYDKNYFELYHLDQTMAIYKVKPQRK